MNLDEYFKKDEEAFYINESGEKKFRGVLKYYGDTVRNDKAKEQSDDPPVPISQVFSYINEFIELLRKSNGALEKNIKKETIVLDNTIHTILDNGIIACGLNWNLPIYDKDKRKYIDWDYKYNIIKDEFGLNTPQDIVWLKFTTKGHVGVVAKGFDINFDKKTSDGKPISSSVLIEEVGQAWNKSFVIIFPLTPEILGERSVGELELGIGKYLIKKGVPIIDYYSHNN